MPLWMLCVAPVVIDGDGFRCRNLGEVRLLGIDAPDYRSSRPCRQRFGDHRCDDRGAKRAKDSLKAALRLGPVRVLPLKRDRYGRWIAQARAGSRDLSCWQLERRVVRYVPRYDDGRTIARSCGL